MVQTITQHKTGTVLCPIKSLARIVHHIIKNGGTDDTFICSIFKDNKCNIIKSADVSKTVRSTASTLDLQKQAIKLDLIGAYSLRSGGEMSLKLHGYNDTTIMKMVRWKSLISLQYINYYISDLSKYILKRMRIEIRFVSLVAIGHDGSHPILVFYAC